MGDLAGAGDSPAIGMVVGFAHFADLHAAGIIGLHRIQAVGANVFFRSGEFNII